MNTLGPSMENIVDKYYTINSQIKTLKKEHSQLNTDIKSMLIHDGTYVSSNYEVTIGTRINTSVDINKLKELGVSDSIISKATRATEYQALTIIKK